MIAPTGMGPASRSGERTLRLRTGRTELLADLDVPEGARGLVIFAHGSGSSRRSTRNRRVAAALRDRGLGTLLMDLLSPEEAELDERTRALRFDIPFLADRLVEAIDWGTDAPGCAGLSVGLFGASTGAAAALVAAGRRPERVRAVVSRGGRPDLAGTALLQVRSPTLLIVGGRDLEVLALNRAALTHLEVEKSLVVVPGAGHLFEGPGELESVAVLAAEWFVRHL